MRKLSNFLKLKHPSGLVDNSNLNSEVSPLQPLSENTTITLDGSQDTATLQAIVDSIPKNLGGFRLEFYLDPSPPHNLVFNNFYNGEININTLIVLDADFDVDTLFMFNNVTALINFIGITVNLNGHQLFAFPIQATNCPYVKITNADFHDMSMAHDFNYLAQFNNSNVIMENVNIMTPSPSNTLISAAFLSNMYVQSSYGVTFDIGFGSTLKSSSTIANVNSDSSSLIIQPS